MSTKTKQKEEKELELENLTEIHKVQSDNELESDEDNINEEILSTESKLEQELVEEKNKFLRLFAEFENYKKRTAKERIDLFKTANQDVILAMLPILDDFERALIHIEEGKVTEELREGVFLIYNKLIKTLEQKGLIKLKVSKGDKFNADNHEAVSQIPSPSEDFKGKVIDIVEQGYQLGDKTIRFPKVIIGQ